MDECAKETGRETTTAKTCAAAGDSTLSEPTLKKDVTVNFTGAVTSSVKHVQRILNLQSVNRTGTIKSPSRDLVCSTKVVSKTHGSVRINMYFKEVLYIAWKMMKNSKNAAKQSL